MKLTFLGRGAAFNPLEGNTAAYWLEGRRLLLLDCGETVFRELMRLRLLDEAEETCIAVSHLHSDHSGSLGSTVLYCAEKRGRPARIICPADDGRFRTEIAQLLGLFGAKPGTYSFVPETEVTGFEGFSAIRYVPCLHAPGMNCYSIAMETPAGGVFYTADTATDDGIRDFMRTHPGFEAIYAETVNAPRNPVHLPLAALAEAVPADLRQRVHIMHLNGEGCAEAAEALGFRVVSRTEVV